MVLVCRVCVVFGFFVCLFFASHVMYCFIADVMADTIPTHHFSLVLYCVWGGLENCFSVACALAAEIRNPCRTVVLVAADFD